MVAFEDFRYSIDKTEEFSDLPDDFFEGRKVVAPADSLRTRDYLKSIVEHLRHLPEFQGLSGHPLRFRFLMTDDLKSPAEVWNARDYDSDERQWKHDPIILVSRQLLSLVDSEDQLAGVAFHEVAHPMFFERYGLKSNSPFEENYADYKSAQWMVDTGYNWRELERLFRNWMNPTDDALKERLESFADPHSHLEDRIKHIRTGLGAAGLKDYREIPEPQPRPIPAQERINAANVIPHLSYWTALKEFAGYDAMSRNKKIRFLIDNMAANDTKDSRAEVRRNEFLETLESLASASRHWSASSRPLSETAEFEAACHELFDTWAANKYPELVRVYETVQACLTGHKPAINPDRGIFEPNQLIPLGRLRSLPPAVARFANACTFEEAKEAGAQLVQEFVAIKKILSGGDGSLYQYGYGTSLRLNAFPSSSFIRSSDRGKPLDTVPWDRFIDWAAEDESGAVARALWTTGISNDKRLWERAPFAVLKNLTDYNSDLRDDDGLRLDPKYEYYQTQDTQEFNSYVFERERLEMPDIPFTEMLENKNSFFTKYRLLLTTPDKIGSDIAHAVNPYALKSGPNEDKDAVQKRKWRIYDRFAKQVVDQLKRHLAEDGKEKVLDFIGSLHFAGGYSHPAPTPYAQMLLDNHNGVFTKNEQMIALASGGYADQSLKWWQKNLGFKPAQTLVEFADYADSFGEVRGYLSRKVMSGLLLDNLSQLLRRQDHLDPFGGTALKLSSKIAERSVFSLKSNRESNAYDYNDTVRETREELRKILWGQDGTKWKFDKYRTLGTLSLKETVAIFVLYSDEELFPNMAVRTDFAHLILDKIATEPKNEQKEILLANVLSFDNGASAHLMRIPAVRKRAVDMYTDLAVANLGGPEPVGNESAAYREKCLAECDLVRNSMARRNSAEVITMLANKVVAQRELAFAMRDKVNTGKTGGLDWSSIPIKGGEAFFEFMSGDEKGRRCIIEFLASPLSEEACENLANDLESAGYSGRLKNYKGELSKYDLFKKMRLDDADIDDRDKHRKLVTAVWDVHANFWQQSVEIRALLMDYILAPAHAVAHNAEKAYDDAADLVLDRLFPVEAAKQDLEDAFRDAAVRKFAETECMLFSPSDLQWMERRRSDAIEQKIMDRFNSLHPGRDLNPEEKKQNEWARLFVKTYLRQSHETERTLLLSVFLSAAEQLDGEKAGFGKRLGMVIEAMSNPAYYKLGQAIHSSDQVSDDVHKGMEFTKSKAGLWDRWTLFERMDEVLPKEERDLYQWVGQVKGGASFFVNTQVRVDGANDMLGILRKNARRDSKAGFDKIEACARALTAEAPEFASIGGVIVEMISQAREMTDVETDLGIAAQQAAIMAEKRNGLTVTVNNRAAHYQHADWKASGEEWKRAREVSGVHFNELPEATLEQRDTKKFWAKVIALPVIMDIMAGEEFDRDRHGEQCRIDGDQIGIFDDGGVILRRPDVDEKKLLGKTLGTAIKGQQGFGATIFNEVANFKQTTGQRPDYLLHVQTAFQAMGDAFRMFEPDDVKELMLAVWKADKIDPTIKNAVLKELPFFMASGLKLAATQPASLTVNSATRQIECAL